MKNLLFLMLIMFSAQLSAQFFNGEIIYEIRVIPKEKEIHPDSIKSNRKGDIANYLITDGYYKSTYYKNGDPTYSYIYHKTTKRMYDDYVEREYVTFRDSRRANYKYTGSKVYKDSIIQHLGMECFMVEYESSYGTSKTYYSDDLKVNYESFQDHKVGNWYDKLKEVDGCISLKSITEFDDHYEIQEAIEIKKKQLTFADFELPKSKPIYASYLALDKGVELVPPTPDNVKCYQEKVASVLKNQESNNTYNHYVSFIVKRNGGVEFIKSVEEDKHGFHDISVDIIKNCGFKFNPGEINGKPVGSEAYFPIEFQF